MIAHPHYNITDKVYEGLATLIYRGQRRQDHVPVILKVLKSDYPAPRDIAKFRHEYELSSAADLAGVVQPYALEQDHGHLMLVLEDFGGESLLNLLQQGPLDLDTFYRVALTLTETLGHLHQRNLIHKDVKPNNVIVNLATNTTKLTDFGIASRAVREAGAPLNGGGLEGSLAYMSPEQTGRMNRVVDYRTDFYSLGVTFFEMLTGVPPFQGTDAMEMVHSHIAKHPPLLHTLRPEIPPMLSAIVMKLMAKTAENRYQSAYGLRVDLEKWYAAWKAGNSEETFVLGEADLPSRFHIPQKLYGRDAELALLHAAFDRVSRGHTELLLVSGPAGIGKSVLVREVQKPLVREGGYFISGKFDQLQRTVPYASLIQAFQELMRQILTESEARIKKWREALANAVGPNGQVLIDVIPEVELILGPQPHVASLGPTEAQNRFQLVFQNFVRLFSNADHPLVLFLDDLQWADSSSLKLLRLLLSDPDSTYLLVIGAYREQEVGDDHPLRLTLAELQKAQTPINTITLGPLTQTHVSQLLSETLFQEPPHVAPLGEVVHAKTGGNPFFLNQYLLSLAQEKFIWFDTDQGRWQWDLAHIQNTATTDNVVAFMVGKIQKLPLPTQRVVRLAACIGDQFDLKTLATVCEQSTTATGRYLWPAITEGLILPIGQEYKLLPHYDEETVAQVQVLYRFLHDRVQQAAYSLIPAERKAHIHLQVGRLLRHHTSPEVWEERLFDIVNHLNVGQALIQDSAERLEVARLNLRAGQKAKASTAYDAATTYLAAGLAMLPPTAWQTEHDLTLALHQEQAEARYLSGQFEEAERLFDLLLQQAHSKFEQAYVFNLRITLYTVQGKAAKAFDVGREAIRLFGIDIPDTQAEQEAMVAAEVATAQANLGNRRIPDLIHAPELQDPERQVLLTILLNMVPPAYFLSPTLFTLIVMKQVNISLQYGHAPASAYAYVIYGLVLAGLMRQYEQAYEFGELALKINEYFNDVDLKCKVNYLFGGMFSYFRRPLSTTLSFLHQAHSAGLDSGDFIYLSYASFHIGYIRFALGDDLNEVDEDVARRLALARRTKEALTTALMVITRQVIAALQGKTKSPESLQDELFEEEAFLDELAQNSLYFVVSSYRVFKLQLLYLYGRYTEALPIALDTEATILNITGNYGATDMVFYAALVFATLYPTAPSPQREEYWAQLTTYRDRVQTWAENSPQNYRHKLLLLQAEIARISGAERDAMDLYEQAIEAARADGFPRYEAQANEMAGRFYLHIHKPRIARTYLLEARYGYLNWGASAKAQQLSEEFPQLLVQWGDGRQTPSLSHLTLTTTTTTQRGADALDLATVLKTSQVIAGEIVLETLLATVMKIVIENAGAQRGVLILKRENQLFIQAESIVDSATTQILQAIPLDQKQDLPHTLIHYVSRTRQSVMLHNAMAEERFQRDTYIATTQPKSILCTPMIHRGNLVGLLYLENNLTTGAFTPERLNVVALLSTQTAISIENALVYSRLEEKVAQRTAELAEATVEAQAARTAAEQANQLKSRFLTNMSHELRTPLNSIINFTGFVLDDIFGELNDQQRQYLSLALNSSEHLLGLINDILDLAKVEAGRMELYPEEVELGELFKGVMSTAVGLVQHQPITLSQEIPATLPPVYADRTRLRQILLNLLSNAAKFTDQGTITLRAEIVHDELIISVADTGVGIAAEDQSKVFEEFAQVGDAKHQAQGTGLGMPISKRFVEMHGGRMWLHSTPGEGSTFFFSLPLTSPLLETA